jgi:streptogramin lyase
VRPGLTLTVPLAAAALLAVLALPARQSAGAVLQAVPVLSIAGVATETEGKHGSTRPYHFTVTLDPPSNVPVTVSFGTASLIETAKDFNFAVATADKDYVTTGGTLIFAPGETTKTIRVTIVNDDDREPNEAFFVALFNPINATISADNGAALGKITNQELPYLTPEFAEEFQLGIGLKNQPMKPTGGMVLGPDGKIWMTDFLGVSLIIFDTATKTATQVALPAGVDPHFLTVGPDNNIWFTSLADQIGRVDVNTHAVTLFTQGITPGSRPHIILPGPDGLLYFTEQAAELVADPFGRRSTRLPGNGRLARLDPQTGQITEFHNGVPAGNRMHGMVMDADGNPWVTLEGVDQIARFNRATLTYDRFVQFSKGSTPTNLLLGPDKKLYVTLEDVGRLGQFDPVTGKVKEFSMNLTPQDGFSLVFFTVGPDNNIWFTEDLNDRIGVFEIATQKITEMKGGITPGAAPIGIIVGPDNAIWFNEVVLDLTAPGRVARLVPEPPHHFVEPSGGFTTAAYRDLLERDVDDAGLTFFGPLIAAGQANNFQTAQAILHSQISDIEQVRAEYQRLLDREPTPAELANLVGQMQRGADMRDVDVFIMGTAEYSNVRGQGTVGGFLQAVYNDLLGRNPNPKVGAVFNPLMILPGRRLPNQPPLGVPGDPTNLGQQFTPDQYPKTFQQAVARQAIFKDQRTPVSFAEIARVTGAGGRANIAGVLAFSVEGTQKLIRSFYGRFNLGPADNASLAKYTSALLRGVPVETIMADIAGSSKYMDIRVLAKRQ